MSAGEIPAWSPRAVLAALVAGWIGGGLLAVALALPVALIADQGGDPSPGTALAASLGFGAGLIGATVAAARRAEPVRPWQLGLVRPAAGPALAWTALAALVLGAAGFFCAMAIDLAGAVAVPEELERTVASARAFGASGGPAPGALDAGVALSALGRVVVPALVAEVVLRGFVLPALSRWAGDAPAVAVCALLTAAPVTYAAGAGDAALLIPGVALGLVCTTLRFATDSVLPGTAASAAALGAVFSLACELPAAQAVALCAVSAVLAAGAGALASGPLRD